MPVKLCQFPLPATRQLVLAAVDSKSVKRAFQTYIGKDGNAYSQSCALSGLLIDLIMQQSTVLGCVRDQQKQIKSTIKGTQRRDQFLVSADLKSSLPPTLQ